MKIEVNKRNSAIGLFILNVILFVVLTMPFRIWVDVTKLTDMRPVTAMTPVFGMLFGFPAALGSAIGSLICDFWSGYELSYSCFNAICQVIFAMVPYYLWKRLISERGGDEFRLNRVSKILKFALVLFIDSLIIVICTGFLNHSYNVTDFISMDNLYLLINNFDSGLLFGIPILVLGNLLQRYISKLQNKSHEKVLTFSMNERMILNTIITGIVLCFVVAGIVYLTNYLNTSGVFTNLLGQMFLFETLLLNIYFALAIGFMYYTEKKIALPVEKLAEVSEGYYLDHSSKDDRYEMVNVCRQFSTNSNEVGDLARSYISMIEDIDKYIENLKAVTKEKERINAELSLASDIQAHMLPCIFPPFPEHKEFDIFATMTPAKEVGGDFYDYYMLDENRLALVVADVSGKGIPAALFMVITKSLIKNHVQSGLDPAEAFGKVNNLLCEGNDADLFVSSWLGVIDLKTGVLNYVSAGHNPPLIKRGDKSFEFLRCTPELVLAGIEGTVYSLHEVRLNEGDGLFLYTDGVTEATDIKKDLYGEARLCSYLNQHISDDVVFKIKGLKDDIDTFVGEAPQFDDMTMLSFELKNYR